MYILENDNENENKHKQKENTYKSKNKELNESIKNTEYKAILHKEFCLEFTLFEIYKTKKGKRRRRNKTINTTKK